MNCKICKGELKYIGVFNGTKRMKCQECFAVERIEIEKDIICKGHKLGDICDCKKDKEIKE